MQNQEKPQNQDISDVVDEAGMPLPETAAPAAESAPKSASENAPKAEPKAEPSLEEKLAAAEKRAEELQDGFLRAKAEVENSRRRAQEDIARAHKFAIANFAEALLPVKDSLETSLRVETPSIDVLKEGAEMTLKQLNAAFEKSGLKEITPVKGDQLDPARHQAISMEPAEQNANTVVSVLQKGYMIAGRLLRPALVTVAQGKAGREDT